VSGRDWTGGRLETAHLWGRAIKSIDSKNGSGIEGKMEKANQKEGYSNEQDEQRRLAKGWSKPYSGKRVAKRPRFKGRGLCRQTQKSESRGRERTVPTTSKAKWEEKGSDSPNQKEMA